MQKETITKLDAAVRQLNIAVEMWFQESDIVATHTLACSAHQLIFDIKRKESIDSEMLFDSLIFKDEFRNKAIKHLKKEYNFFKHADKDPDATIEFNGVITQYYILISLRGLLSLNVVLTGAMRIFSLYYSILHPQHLNQKGKEELAEASSEELLQDVRFMSKSEFFKLYQTYKQNHNNG